MKKCLKLGSVFVGATLLVGCSHNDSPSAPAADPTPVPVQFYSNVIQPTSRDESGSSFEDGTNLYIYMVDADGNETKKTYNVTSGEIKPSNASNTLYWPYKGDASFYLANENFPNCKVVSDIAIGYHQENDYNYKRADVILGEPTTNPVANTAYAKENPSTTVNFVCRHIMSKVVLNIKADPAPWIDKCDITFGSSIYYCFLNMQEGTMTFDETNKDNNTQNITNKIESGLSSGQAIECPSIFIPQTISKDASEPFITIVAKSADESTTKTYKYTLSEDLVLQSGFVYTFNLNLIPEKTAIGITATVTNWNTGATIGTESDPIDLIPIN